MWNVNYNITHGQVSVWIILTLLSVCNVNHAVTQSWSAEKDYVKDQMQLDPAQDSRGLNCLPKASKMLLSCYTIYKTCIFFAFVKSVKNMMALPPTSCLLFYEY